MMLLLSLVCPLEGTVRATMHVIIEMKRGSWESGAYRASDMASDTAIGDRSMVFSSFFFLSFFFAVVFFFVSRESGNQHQQEGGGLFFF